VAESIAAGQDDGRPRVFPHDVTDYDAVPRLFQRILAEMGRVDVVVYAAGVLYPADAEEYDFAKDRPMLETNLLGAVAWLGQAAAYFQTQGEGHIVGISSVAGDRGRVKNPAYQASKAGLTNYLESLRNRLSRRGVHVLTVKPGFVDTPMLQAAGGGAFWVISPDKAAADIAKALRKRKQVIYTPGRWRWVMLTIQHIPSWLFRRLSV
jgi:short-subunit dehydrogenase